MKKDPGREAGASQFRNAKQNEGGSFRLSDNARDILALSGRSRNSAHRKSHVLAAIPFSARVEASLPPTRARHMAGGHLRVRADARLKAGVHVGNSRCDAVMALVQAERIIAQRTR